MHTRYYLRAEAVAVALAALAGYYASGEGAILFVVLLFAPDLSAAGYLLGDEIGAVTYNLAHLYVWPIALLGVGLSTGESLATSGGLIWLFHIGLDRSIGYGLKEGSFRETHLGAIGRARSSE